MHYVDFKWYIIEPFLDIVYVSDTTALSLKTTIEALFFKHNSSILRIRGHGYDEASNM